jgi:hypothetical protein
MKWSYSTLNKFLTCPRQYVEVKVRKTFIESETYAKTYGKEVHKALEDYVNHGKQLPTNYRQYQKYLDAVRDIPGTKHTELQLALRRDRSPCGFDDPEYWVRGIGDWLSIDHDYGFYIDYKTGSDKYADTKQLRIMALMMFAHFPVINHIKAGLLFIAKNRFIDETYRREDLDKLWDSFANDLSRFQNSIDNDWWPCNPSGLCKRHCPVSTCEYYGGV